MAGSNMAERLHQIFEEAPFKLDAIDIVRAIKWDLDSNKQARIRCFTAPVGVSFPQKTILGEHEYPRRYSIDLAFPFDDLEISFCVAQSSWTAESRQSEPVRMKAEVRGFPLDFKTFDLANLGTITPDPGTELTVFKEEGFVTPNIMEPEGVSELLETFTRNRG